MKLIPADHQGHVEIAGVPEPVQRPVAIDRSHTGFTRLRSLRIYRFEAGSVIDGHAEEDEVLIVVLAGSIDLALIDNSPAASPALFTLSAASDLPGHPCAAYLPPQGAYQLVAKSSADVAYARATPASGPPSVVLSSQGHLDHAAIAVLLREDTYPQLLRVRLLQVSAGKRDIAVTPLEEEDAASEALVHIRIVPEEGGATITGGGAPPVGLTSWDSIAVAPGDHPTLHVAVGSSALILVVLAQ